MSLAGLRLQLPGVLLFLFIPAVLYLFVRHPEPTPASVALGIFMMLGHRFLARPYMFWSASQKCLWSNRPLATEGEAAITLRLRQGTQEARCLRSRHRQVARFFTYAYRRRALLALGIFAPLLALLIHLILVAAGQAPVEDLKATRALFQLAVGLTVNLAAWGYLTVDEPDADLRVMFPVHNFFLLGIGNLLWIFRLMGTWWIFTGGRYLFDWLF